MNYRVFIKNKLPAVERLLRRHESLMRVAIKAESWLYWQKLRIQSKRLPANYPSVKRVHKDLLKRAKRLGVFDARWYGEFQQHVYCFQLSHWSKVYSMRS